MIGLALLVNNSSKVCYYKTLVIRCFNFRTVKIFLQFRARKDFRKICDTIDLYIHFVGSTVSTSLNFAK